MVTFSLGMKNQRFRSAIVFLHRPSWPCEAS
jgi:hypothetical protein